MSAEPIKRMFATVKSALTAANEKWEARYSLNQADFTVTKVVSRPVLWKTSFPGSPYESIQIKRWIFLTSFTKTNTSNWISWFYLIHKLFLSTPLDIHPHTALLPCHISLGRHSLYYSFPGSCNHSDPWDRLQVFSTGNKMNMFYNLYPYKKKHFQNIILALLPSVFSSLELWIHRHITCL